MTIWYTLAMMALAGVVGIIPGWLAYSGKWRSWRLSSYTLYAPLACFWMGIGFEVAGVGALLEEAGLPSLLAKAFIYAGVAFLPFGLFCLFWTPSPLQPRWFREERRREKEEQRRKKEERRKQREERKRRKEAW